MNEPLVKNAADVRQVRHATRKQTNRAEHERSQMRAVLATGEGRAVFWRLLGRLGYGLGLDTIAPEAREITAGKQAAMWMVLGDVVDADEDSLIKMMREARTAEKREADEANAVRTAGATEGDTE